MGWGGAPILTHSRILVFHCFCWIFPKGPPSRQGREKFSPSIRRQDVAGEQLRGGAGDRGDLRNETTWRTTRRLNGKTAEMDRIDSIDPVGYEAHVQVKSGTNCSS